MVSGWVGLTGWSHTEVVCRRRRPPIPLLTGHDVEHLRRFAHAPDVTSQWFFDLPLLVYINAKIVTLHILRLQRDAYAQRIRPIVVWLWGGVWAWDRVSPPVLHTHSINASSVSSVCSYHLYFCVAAYARMWDIYPLGCLPVSNPP